VCGANKSRPHSEKYEGHLELYFCQLFTYAPIYNKIYMEQGGEGQKFDLATPDLGQVITLPIAKSQARNKHSTDTQGGSVYSEWVVLLPVLALAGGCVGVLASEKIATCAPPCRCDVTYTFHRPDPTYEHAVCATRENVAYDLKISPYLASQVRFSCVARTNHRRMRSGIIKQARAASPVTWGGSYLYLNGDACFGSKRYI
jgi:hypothetical protein